MLNITFILGAGASAQGGCPTMANFFSRASDLYDHGLLGPFDDDFRTVERVRDVLRASQSKVTIDITNMERVFNVLDMAQDVGHLREHSENAIRDAKRSFTRLTMGVLERTQELRPNYLPNDNLSDLVNVQPPIEQQPDEVAGPIGYDALARWIKHILSRKPRASVSIISFNYDIGVELALKRRGVTFTYSVNNDSGTPEMRPVQLLKLHGSLNWWKDDQGNIHRIQVDDISKSLRHIRDIDYNSNGSTSPLPRVYYISEIMASVRKVSIGDIEPFIIPPSEGKSLWRRDILDTWKLAADALSRANVLFISGYSMPSTDEFFRNFFSLGFDSMSDVRCIILCDKSSDSTHRLQGLFGESLRGTTLRINQDFLFGLKTLARLYESTHGSCRLHI